MAVIHRDEYVRDIFDEAIKNDQPVRVNRDMRMMELAEDGSYVKLWVSSAMNSDVNMMWHPKELHQEILDNIGYPPPTATLTMGDKTLMLDCMNLCWEHTMDWQSDALNYLMENDGYEVVFSHFHAPDLQEHMFIRDMKKGRPNCSPAEYEEIMQTVYKQADRYIGKFLHFLDEGWTILLVSDHAQVCPTWGIRGCRGYRAEYSADGRTGLYCVTKKMKMVKPFLMNQCLVINCRGLTGPKPKQWPTVKCIFI